jgi:methyl-accepting chemotaxis protein
MKLGIQMRISLPVYLVMFVTFVISFGYIVVDQSISKQKALMAKADNTTQLIALTSIINVWNMDQASTELNVLSFLKDSDLVSIEIKDMQNNQFIKKANEIKGGRLFTETADIIYTKDKIGSVEAVFTDYNIARSIAGLILQFVIILIIALPVTSIFIFLFLSRFTTPIRRLTKIATAISSGESVALADIPGKAEISDLAASFNSMTGQLRDKAESFRNTSDTLGKVIAKAKEIIVSLNSSSKEIEAASQEQTSSASENASAITEVSATLQELTITAKQITNNVGELVYSSEEATKLLQEGAKQLLNTVSELEEVGAISKSNAAQIAELGKRSALINEMVELIKEVANKTNILSINASIEASRSGEAGAGFSVVAAEIRELSKETIESAKKAEVAAREIGDYLSSIIVSSGNESMKVVGSGKIAKGVYENMEKVVSKISNNYSFTQKIDVSIKQQESGSIQAAETMRQMAEIARQSAETARQTLSAAKDIVTYGSELDSTVAGVEQKKNQL